jgi:hypothetical protein
MKQSDIPDRFELPFASSAGGAFVRAIPKASQIGIQAGAASLETGFPPANFLATGAGGTPFFGQDVNGILRQITEWNRWQNAGAPVPYNAAFSTAIGGYPKGAVLLATASVHFWLNLVDDNATDPDGGGANWASFSLSGVVNQVGGAVGSISLGAGITMAANVLGAFATGQCRLNYVDATHIALVPYGGCLIQIAGVVYSIPAAGISVSVSSCRVNGVNAQALAASTTYLVYLSNVSGLTLEFMTGTSYAPDSTAGNVGVMIASGAPTLSLVGIVRTDAAGHIIGQGKSVGSWFNRVPIPLVTFVTSVPITSTSLVEISASARIPIVAFSEDAVETNVMASAEIDVALNIISLAMGIDGVNSDFTLSVRVPNSGGTSVALPYTSNFNKAGGFYVSPMGGVSGGNGLFDTMKTSVIVRG